MKSDLKNKMKIHREGLKRMITIGIRSVALLATLVAFSGAALFDHDRRSGTSPDQSDVESTVCIGGGEIPTPFSESNRLVELADGESYWLKGLVMSLGTSEATGEKFGFLVSLKDHPWLANRARKKNPVYPLVGGAEVWQKYLNRKVEGAFRARGVLHYRGETAVYEIRLTLSSGQ